MNTLLGFLELCLKILETMHIISYSKEIGEAIMQYKHKRYSVDTWPCKHNVGEVYHHKQYGVGKVVVCEALKDEISNQKFWCNTVRFTKPDGSQIDVVFKRNAATTTILVFPSAGSEHNLPTTFPLALLKAHSKISSEIKSMVLI